MSTKIVSPATYVAVVVALLVLTALTVGVSFIPLPPAGHVVAGLSIATIKATLVVLIFMHALHSPRLTWCVIVTAVVWILLMASLMAADYLTRNMLPQMPGH
jgi:cytochrome c oxidase subunit 4